MKDTAKEPANRGKKTIRRLLILTAAIALIWAGLVLYKDKRTKEFVTQHNIKAKSMYNLLNTIMVETETPPLPQGNYTGYGRIEGGTMTITPDDPSIAPFTASTDGYYEPESPYYFSYRMEGNIITKTRISQRDVLREAPANRNFDWLNGEKLTMAEFYLDTFTAYYP
ncbi:MAG: hypothetical protein IJM46_12555 [Oscillospiraceae bacterium]|nr:hypothetical protein [Oscillospiraceae bacterium]